MQTQINAMRHQGVVQTGGLCPVELPEEPAPGHPGCSAYW
jgi:hypothetical protein